MIIECKNISAKYSPGIKNQLYKLKNYLQKQPSKPHFPYALFDFTYTFSQGVTILLGPNSAGKSTLLRLLTGILLPAAGAIRFDGQVVNPSQLRRMISYLPQTLDLYPEFSAREMLHYIALLKGFTSSAARQTAVEQALFQTGLSLVAHQKISTYSRGMTQRVGIAQAFLTNTPILLLDEPTAALDPEERNKLLNLFTQLSQERIIVFASSRLTDACCADAVVILQKGRCQFTGSPGELAAAGKPSVLSQIKERTSFTSAIEKGYQTILNQGDIK
ncbi:MAG: ATP-binding cassette domain-containing protein [Pelosinus sp.]|nr:ATP-binding cassette domain-containing protein [Pelosinus sp.]